MTPYNTNLCLSNDGCNCNKFIIEDESVLPNDTVGHNVFGYRKISVLKPSGVYYTYSSLAADDADQSINVFTQLGINKFNYNFIKEEDVDGLYEVTLYNFPVWDETVTYNLLKKYIVFYNGKLYKQKATNLNVNPETDITNTYWELYEISEETLKTRYAKRERIIILCLELDDCYERLVKEAFCEIEGNPCKTLCENKKFSTASKYMMTKKAMCISEDNCDWEAVKKEINLLKSFCCAGGC